MSAISEPADAVDSDLYKPLGGAERMGSQLRDEQVMVLDQAIEGTGDAASAQYDERRDTVVELLEKTRDLRLYVKLAEALSHVDGPLGLHAGLHLVSAVVRGFWDEIHPAPPDERTARNARQRAFGPFRDRKITASFDSVVLFDAGGFDREIRLRSAYIATERHKLKGRRPPADNETKYDVDSLKGLVEKAEATAQVAAVRDALVASSALLLEIQTFLGGHPDYSHLQFKDLREEIDIYASALEPFCNAPPPPVPEAAAGEAAADPAGAASAPAGPAPGAIANREEAEAVLDQILAYYAREGRSSPVALALLKIRSLMGGSFADWIEEIASDGPSEIALYLSGIDAAALDAYAGIEDPVSCASTPAAEPAGLAEVEAALASLRAVATAGQADAGAGEGATESTVETGAEDLAAGLAALGEAVAALRAELAVRPAQGPAQAATPGMIRDRAGVRQALQRLVVFHRTAEPSSPVSLCLERLIDLVDRGFVDILKRIAPSGPKSAALTLS